MILLSGAASMALTSRSAGNSRVITVLHVWKMLAVLRALRKAWQMPVKSSKVRSVVILYGKDNETLTFENFC